MAHKKRRSTKKKSKQSISPLDQELLSVEGILEGEIFTLYAEIASRLRSMEGWTFQQQSKLYDKVAVLLERLRELPDHMSFEDTITFSEPYKVKVNQTGKFIDWVDELLGVDVFLNGERTYVLANQYLEGETPYFILYVERSSPGGSAKFCPERELGFKDTWDEAKQAVRDYYRKEIYRQMGLVIAPEE